MKKFATLFQTDDGRNHWLTFALVCCLFGLSGLCNGMIDVLNKHFKDSLHLSDSQSALVQGAWYGAYFLMAFPGGFVAGRFGYRAGILTGLGIVFAASLLFIPVARMTGGHLVIFAAFLGTLFAVAAGFTFLETVANPYATVLGPPQGASPRLNLAQSFNALGWILGPLLGGRFTLAAGDGRGPATNAALYRPYLVVAALVLVLFFLFRFAPVPDLRSAEDATSGSEPSESISLAKRRHFLFGLGAQFLYVAGQCGIFAFFITYVLDPRLTPALPHWAAERLPSTLRQATQGQWYITRACSPYLLSAAFGLFALGRFSGSAVQRRYPPAVMLGVYGLINVLLMLVVLAGLGWGSVIALMFSFFFMSVMYPTIFALSIRGLGPQTKLGASFMVTTIVGGAIMPYAMGRMIDRFGPGLSFFDAGVRCFGYIAVYGLAWHRLFAPEPGRRAASLIAARP